MMKTVSTHKNKQGFLTFGAAMALLVVYGGMGIAAKSFDNDEERTAQNQRPQSVVIASRIGE